MPQSLNLSTPPQTSNKRQRSRESRKDASRPGSAGKIGAPPPPTDAERLARSGVRLPAYLNKTKSEIAASFQDLEWKQRYRLAGAFQNPNSPFRVDRSNAVVTRNRYTNVQPWDGSRIKLNTTIGGSDYVNASPISLHSLTPGSRHRGRRKASSETAPETQSFNVQDTRYIATQGPKEGQFTHFWHMALQESTGDVGVVVMLTQCYEGLKEKCAEYFPLNMSNPVLELPQEPKHDIVSQTDSDGDPFLDSEIDGADTDSDGTGQNSNESEHGEDAPAAAEKPQVELTEPGTVELLSIRHDATLGSEIRELKVTIGETTKKFYHFFYGNWADFGKVEPEDRMALLQLTRASKRVAGVSPRIVHCSAGVGRTGTWIALDFLLRELEEGRLIDQSYFDSNLQPSKQPQSTNTPLQTATTDRQDPPNPREAREETWGKSGPPKTTTPEPKEQDLIHDTVDLLRTQRMMMVMNEIQYASLYEVLREQFIDKYAEKEIGATVTPAVMGEVEEPSPKIRRMSTQGSLSVGLGGMVMGARGGKLEMAADGKEEEASGSEAETEIEGGGADGDVPMGIGGDGDPYGAVSPEEVKRDAESKGEGIDGVGK